MEQLLILFAHGSKDPAWRRPFEAIAARVREALPGTRVDIAYLEHGPTLLEVLSSSPHARSVRVVPLFLGAGGHVRDDVPRLVEAARKAHPHLNIALDPAIGDEPALIDAITAVICRR